MNNRVASAVVAVSVSVCGTVPAFAADLPAIRTSEQNIVPECVTPGRLMAFVAARNERLDPRFEKIAVEYMRRGEELGLRWDYAFFQMAIETNYLSFRREGGRRSDVKPTQNNFAGLGATGNGEPGESFKDVPTGVLAHLQHILVYAGEEVEDPVADRTRKVVQWGVLKSFHKKIKGSVTYSHLAQKWATSSDYADAIQTHARRFFGEFCKIADPAPGLVAEARGEKSHRQLAEAQPKPETKAEHVSGADLARRAIEEGRGEEMRKPLGLGAAGLAKSQVPKTEAVAEKPEAPPRVAIVNPSAPAASAPTPSKPEAKTETKSEPLRTDAVAKSEKPPKFDNADKAERPTFLTASAAGLLSKQIAPPAAGTKCRVWTASYGGQKAIIIKVEADRAVNYTVLDVNDGAEKREAEAYIAAYAKGGEIAGEFTSQTQALDKAFELCPEG